MAAPALCSPPERRLSLLASSVACILLGTPICLNGLGLSAALSRSISSRSLLARARASRLTFCSMMLSKIKCSNLSNLVADFLSG